MVLQKRTQSFTNILSMYLLYLKTQIQIFQMRMDFRTNIIIIRMQRLMRYMSKLIKSRILKKNNVPYKHMHKHDKHHDDAK